MPTKKQSRLQFIMPLTIVNGFPIPYSFDKDKIMELMADFTVLPDDLFVVGYPKSGTTWVQRIMTLIRQGGEESTAPIRNLIPFLDFGKDIAKVRSFNTTEQLLLYSSVYVTCIYRICNVHVSYFKSHIPYRMMAGGQPAQSVAKYIYVARNPKDVAVSFFHFARHLKNLQFSGDWNCFYDLFMKGDVGYGLWFDHVLEWWKHKGEGV